MKHTITFIVLLLSMYPTKALSPLHVYAIPGQNECGSEEDYVKQLLGENTSVTCVKTPKSAPDFGQDNCISYLRKEVNNTPKDHYTSIIHATSQGTATALNYIAHEDQGKNIRALILEATLASGNSAIHHTVGGPLMKMSHVTQLPFSYYWLPYAAKFLFFRYVPFGKQAIRSVKHIKTTIPIIIAHSKKDPQLSYNDACALYYGLKKQGNDAIYLITKEDVRHIQLLDQQEDRLIVQAILQKHNLIEENNEQKSNNKIDVKELGRKRPSFKRI